MDEGNTTGSLRSTSNPDNNQYVVQASPPHASQVSNLTRNIFERFSQEQSSSNNINLPSGLPQGQQISPPSHQSHHYSYNYSLNSFEVLSPQQILSSTYARYRSARRNLASNPIRLNDGIVSESTNSNLANPSQNEFTLSNNTSSYNFERTEPSVSSNINSETENDLNTVNDVQNGDHSSDPIEIQQPVLLPTSSPTTENSANIAVNIQSTTTLTNSSNNNISGSTELNSRTPTESNSSSNGISNSSELSNNLNNLEPSVATTTISSDNILNASLMDFRSPEKSSLQKNKGQSSDSTAEEEKKVEVADDEDDDDVGRTCMICCNDYTSDGDHRICCLKCGHLFGYSCIKKWLKLKNTRKADCPQCKKPFSMTDIIPLFARNLSAIDNSELIEAKKNLELAKRKSKEKDLIIQRLELEKLGLNQKLDKLQSQVNLQNVEGFFNDNNNGEPSRKLPRKNSSISYSRLKYKKIVGGGCKLLQFCETSHQFITAQPSPTPNIVKGYGVRLFDGELSSTKFIGLHSSLVKDVKFSPHNPNQILSSGQEGRVKVTDLRTNFSVVAYDTGKPAWSCSWSEDSEVHFFSGLVDETYLQFDLRNTSTPLAQFKPEGIPYPLISMQHISARHSFSQFGGLLASSIHQPSFWSQGNGGSELEISEYKPVLFPVVNSCGGVSDVQYDRHTKHVLVTYKPKRTAVSQGISKHVLYQMNEIVSSDQPSSISCNQVETFQGSLCSNFCKNSVFSNCHDHLSVAGVDHARNCVKIFDINSGIKELFVIQVNKPYACQALSFQRGHKKDHIAVLTDDSLTIFKQNQ